MPLHFKDSDIMSQIDGIGSALIVPCNMCPAITVAVREKKPFLRLFSNFLKSAPFEQYLKTLQFNLKERGIRSTVFKNVVPHQWFLCMWPKRRGKKLRKKVKFYDAVIVLGCESATETVRRAIQSTDCKVIEGMTLEGIMNAKLKFNLPGSITFEDCKTLPFNQQKD